MSNCYYYKIIKNNKYLLKNIKRTYILIMENSNNYHKILEQLKSIPLTKEIYFQFNKGFKKCSKNLKQQKTNYDIIDALKNVFLHYNQTVLILEEDAIFNYINLIQSVKEIDNFIINNDFDIINLGSLLYLGYPYKNNMYRTFFNPTAHGVIYNKDYQKIYIDEIDKIDYNDLWWHQIRFKNYCYDKTLFYQLFKESENSKNWHSLFGIDNMERKLIQWIGLDKEYQMNFFKINTFGKMLFYIIIYIFIYIYIHLHL